MNDDLYYDWLCNKLGADPDHYILFSILYRKRFIVVARMDQNFVDNVGRLRDIYEKETGNKYQGHKSTTWCSVLELLYLVALRWDEVISNLHPRYEQWFWEMIRNLGLDGYTDDELLERSNLRWAIEDILDTFMDRTYYYDGRGGLFPLKFPEKDQRKVDIWYQLQAYLLEGEERF